MNEMSEISYILGLFISEKLGGQMPTKWHHPWCDFRSQMNNTFMVYVEDLFNLVNDVCTQMLCHLCNDNSDYKNLKVRKKYLIYS